VTAPDYTSVKSAADTTIYICWRVWCVHLLACLLVCAEKRALYEFIVRHFLASCSKDAVGQETNVTIDIAGEAFRTTGTHTCMLGRPCVTRPHAGA
jgi:hypothetical protein